MIRSDNGTNFVEAEKELCQAVQELNNGSVRDQLQNQRPASGARNRVAIQSTAGITHGRSLGEADSETGRQ